MKEISGGVYHLDLKLANTYLIEGQHGLALVDAGGQGALGLLRKQLTASRFQPADIDHILVTHGHFDHVGGLAEIQAETGADVWAHRLEAPIIRGDAPVVRPEPHSLKRFDRWVGRIIQGPQQPAPVHHNFEAGTALGEIYSGLEVVHLPGHSAGQVGFWLPSVRLLLGGDVLTHFVPWRLTLPLASYS
jgi:glyoxylase-like metal-dependent hydrolase (beta-lactamase superfamily II)